MNTETIPLDDEFCKDEGSVKAYLTKREQNEQMAVVGWKLASAPSGLINLLTFEEDQNLPAKSTLVAKSFPDDANADAAAEKFLADNNLVAQTWGPAAIGGVRTVLLIAHLRSARRPLSPTEPASLSGSRVAAISVGATTYSGPQSDFTTYLDIKPEQRPAELTTYWQSRGYNIEAQEEKLHARGIRTGTLNYSDAFMGAYGKLVSDRTCASCRVPGGSVLALKNPDGTPYDPTGRNPKGEYLVTDTGNAKLTFQKPDIFTDTPNKYTGLEDVQVYLVSKGDMFASQYRIAQSRYA